MEAIIYGKPVRNGVTNLKSLVANFKEYALPQNYSTNDHVQYEESIQATDLIRGSIEQIESGRNSLQSIIDKMKEDYDSTKSKDDKKNILLEIEKLEDELSFTEAISEATELIYMLRTRLTEASSNESRLARKLGKCPRALSVQNDLIRTQTSADQANSAMNELTQKMEQMTSIPPPKINLPKFYGRDEEFPEFWAAYETLVHNNPSLSVIAKMLLLKDSLRGRSDKAIKGIQLLPQNYDWMVETLKKKYGNKPANRSRIVQQIRALRQADQRAESNEFVYDKICMLLNQMVSAGQDIRITTDAMWTELILSKFHRDIVEPVLVKMREEEDATIESIMEMIEKEIAAKSYIQSRMQPIRKKGREQGNTTDNDKRCVICEKVGHPAWQCRSPMTVPERRKVAVEKRLCWKCYSDKHSSNECARANCSMCGKLHHVKLCFSTENPNEAANRQNSAIFYRGLRQNPQSYHDQTQQSKTKNFVKTESPKDSRRAKPIQEKAHNTNLHINGGFEQNEELDGCRTDHGPHREEVQNTESHAAIERSHRYGNQDQIVLMTAEGRIWNYNSESFEKAVFFFDTGAQKTIIEEEFAIKLGLPSKRTETCIMSGIGGNTEIFESSIVNVKIGTAYGKDMEILIQTKPVLTKGFPGVRLSTVDKQFLQDRNILVCNPTIRGEHQLPQVLVGLDYYYNFMLDNDSLITPSGLRLANTVFGPSIYGRGSIDPQDATITMPTLFYSMTATTDVTSESAMLKKLFELEGMGISSEDNTEDNELISYFKKYSKQISFRNGYVVAPFPLKDNVCDLTDNYPSAIRRLVSLHRQLEKNPRQKEWYCKILKQYESDDIIEPVSGNVPNSVGLYYMPHSGVWRENKPNPLRIVFDASSKRKGQLSLNDVTLKGESLVRKIHDILIASRTGKIIMTCDIEAAFTQIRLLDAHKDLCRFLWLRNPDEPPTRDNIIEYRFKRVPFGAKPSPSILNMSLLAFLQAKNSQLSREILDNLYVDNVLLCAATPSEAVAKYKDSKALLAEIGMNLREYISSCKEVNDTIPDKDKAPAGITKLLGVTYDTEGDQFKMKITLCKKIGLTKKDIVSQLNSIYDPIGIVSPLTIRLKHLMREIYDTGIEWKDLVPNELAYKWNKICQELNGVCVCLPRYIGSRAECADSRCTLWVFADASATAMATCAFLRQESTKKVSSLISGKTRLAPKKTKQTIPRLEMLAILMAIRLAKTIVAASNIKLEQVKILSDSEIALSWVKSQRALPSFIENQKCRIVKQSEVLKAQGVEVNFFHVPTEDNPADAATRGVNVTEIHDLPWINGPQWLSNELTPHRLKPLEDLHKSEIEGETRSVDDSISDMHTTERRTTHTPLVQLSRFSSLTRALRTTARVAKTALAWVNKTNLTNGHTIRLENLHRFHSQYEITAEDLALCETLLIREAHACISLEELHKRFPQKKIFRDGEGVIRYASRLQNAPLPYDTRNPIFLEKDSEITRLILRDIHTRNAHCGKDHTLCIARQRFWIPRPSGTFNKFLKNCVTCKKVHGLPFGAPDMPSLPTDRVVLTQPFQTVGCDFMGPFSSKNNEKLYICLYTCLTTRAVHLEVVEDMSAETFLNSFIRFISRRGTPKLIRTDCGTNFKLGQQVIETMFQNVSENNENSVMSYSANHGIKWIFNPPSAPWMGGAWERLVGTVKRAFAKAIGRRKLSHSELYTAVTQIEAIINTRPLTHLNSSNVDEIPIRPIDFLQSALKYDLTPTESHQDDPGFEPNLIQTTSQARQALEHMTVTANKFWERWHTEYLTSLREIQCTQLKQRRHARSRKPSIGEIVLIEQDNIPRGCWCYGKIIELVKSTDEQVRSVKILMPNGHLWHRPLNKIYPLEIRSTSHDEYQELSDEHSRSPEQQVDGTNPEQNRPPRKAKLRAKKIIQDAIKSLSGENDSSRTSPPSARSSLCMAILMIALLFSQVDASPPLLCEKGMIRVFPPNGTFEICVRTTCKRFLAMPTDFSLQLPSTTANNNISVLMKYRVQNSLKKFHVICALPHICETSKDMFSKGLIGNPHCWPIRAFISIASIVYAVVSIPFLVMKTIELRRNAPQEGGQTASDAKCQTSFESSVPRDRDTKTCEQGRRSCTNEKIDLKTFSPQRLSITVAVIFALVMLCGQATPCQHGHMRHYAEITCNSTGKCSMEFSREILFNEINTQMCVTILHANKSIGKISFRRIAVELHCSPRSLMFTRDTDLTVFSAKRCAWMGSCVGQTCSEIRPSTIIPELANASRYPGYSGCEESCGSLFCGCPTILPSCSFYRIAHVPRSEFVYEVVECMEWKPIVKLQVDISLYNNNIFRTFSLRPYVPQRIDDISITVISLTKPTSPILHSKFAVASSEILAVPEGYKFPVECPTRAQASSSFHLCKNRMICDCNVRNMPIRCDCPSQSIGHIRKDVSNVLPISTPFVRITGENGSIIAHSAREEMTISIESKFMKESAEYIVHQACEVSLGPLTGCYSCLEGALLNVYCLTQQPAWVIVLCDDHSFSVECDPSNKSTQVILDFPRAIVAQQCRIECNENHSRLQLHGVLAYVPQLNDTEILNSHERPWTASSSWFHDFSIPDLRPLMVSVSAHWKTALAIFGTTALLGVATYFFGPVVILYVMQLLFACVELLAKLAVTLLLAICELIKKACQK